MRKALSENNIPYFLVFPEKCLKQVWEYRLEKRGDNQKFMSFILDNWDKFIEEMEAETFPTKIRLTSSVNNDAITVDVMNGISDYSER